MSAKRKLTKVRVNNVQNVYSQSNNSSNNNPAFKSNFNNYISNQDKFHSGEYWGWDVQRSCELSIHPDNCSDLIELPQDHLLTQRLIESLQSHSIVSLNIPYDHSGFVKTQALGYCSLLMTQQIFFKYMIVNKSIDSLAESLMQLLVAHNANSWNSGMRDWLYQCLEAGLPQYGLQLSHDDPSIAHQHQLLFEQWLTLVELWACHSVQTLTALRNIRNHRATFLFVNNYYPSSLPKNLWLYCEDLAAIRFPFEFALFQRLNNRPQRMQLLFVSNGEGPAAHLQISMPVVSRILSNGIYAIHAGEHFFCGSNTLVNLEEAQSDLTLTLLRILFNTQPVNPPPEPMFPSPMHNIHTPYYTMRQQIWFRQEQDPWFCKQENKLWLRNYLASIPKTSQLYPDIEVREGFKHMLDWFKVVESPYPNAGKSLICLKTIPPYATVLIFGGTPNVENNEYSMQLPQFSITPDLEDPCCIAAFCNEDIWELGSNNLDHTGHGMLENPVPIPIRSQSHLSLSYGSLYSWQGVLDQHIKDISPIISCLASIPEANSPPLSALTLLMNPDTRPPKIQQLLELFYHPHSDLDMPVEPLFSQMHNFAPPQNMSPSHWLEFMLRNRWVYSNFSFRRRGDPRGLYYPAFNIKPQNELLRRSTRKVAFTIPTNFPVDPSRLMRQTLRPTELYVSNKKRRLRAPGADLNDFELIPLHPSYKFQLLYQSSSPFPLPVMQPLLTSVSQPNMSPMLAPITVTQSPAAPANITDSQSADKSMENNPLPPRSNGRHQSKPASGDRVPSDWPYELTNDNLRALFMNLDGSDINVFYDIVSIMITQNIDLGCFVDVRFNDNIATIRMAFQHTQYKIYYQPQTQSDRKCFRVGGVLFIVGPRISRVTFEALCLEGSLSAIHGFFGQRRIHFLGTYWPVKNSNPTSLWKRMESRYQCNPIEAVQALISETVLGIRTLGNPCFLLGDMNSDATSTRLAADKYKLEAFRIANQLSHASTPEQLLISSYGSLNYDGYGQSRLDYVLHNSLHIKQSSCFPSDLLHHIGAHRCLLLSTFIHSSCPRGSIYKQQSTLRDINLQRIDKVEVIQKSLMEFYNQELLESDMSPENIISATVQRTVDLVQQHTSKKRFKYNYFSPKAAALQTSLHFLRKIAIGVQGSKAHLPWSQRAFKRNMTSITKSWKKRLLLVCRLTEQDPQFHTICSEYADCYGLLYWQTKTLSEVKHVITTAYHETKQRLHARRRRDMRLHFSERERQMEAERKSGKLKQMITHVLGNKRKPYTFNELIVEDDIDPITDPQRIHQKISEHFTLWFEPLEGAQASNNMSDWQELAQPWDTFRVRFQETGIPDHLLKSIHTALQSGPTAEKQAHMQQVLQEAPTFAEFQEALKFTGENTAPGVSGLTYSMIKMWPVEILRFIYDQLLIMWNHDYSFPAAWQVKWLAPIPKTAVPSLDNLRPISLLETLRKLWVAVIIDRIQTLFKEGGYLHPSQHGCLRGVGTDEAILEVLNVLEAAREGNLDQYIASWDMKKAFDRVPKAFLVFSWIRLGVPIAIALYLVALDVGGTTIIKTPVATQARFNKDYKTLMDLGFEAGTGCSQGDPQSAISWNAFIDVLLVALHSSDDSPSFRTHDGHRVKQLHAAYVDDILSLLLDGIELQRQAELVSAFTILSGMQISISKLKAFRFNWGPKARAGPESFTVFTVGWQPNIVTLAREGSFKYLGLVIDSQGRFAKQFDITCCQLRTLCNLIVKAQVSVESKIAIIKQSLIPKILYATKFTSWKLHQYQLLDSILDQAFRKILNVNPTLASALLHMHNDHAGLKLPKLSVLINERKWKLVIRLFQQSPYRRAVIDSLVSRGSRDDGFPEVGKGYILRPTQACWWITSVLQFFASNSLCLVINGSAKDPIPRSPHFPPQVHICVGQLWASHVGIGATYREIVSFSDNYSEIHYVSWSQTYNFAATQRIALYPSRNPGSPKGADGAFMVPLTVFFPTNATQYLVTASKPSNTLVPSRIIIESTEVSPIFPVPAVPSSTIPEILQTLDQNVDFIFTDGGWKNTGNHSDPLQQNISAGGAIVLHYRTGGYGCIQLVVDIEVNSVYPVELIALALARMIGGCHNNSISIFSDSKAAIDAMRSIDRADMQKQYLQSIVAQRYLYNANPILHVKSHVEKRKTNHMQWSAAETGNYIADALTTKDWSNSTEANIKFNDSVLFTVPLIASFTMSTVVNFLASHNPISICHLHTQKPYILNPSTKALADLAPAYLQTRDEYRIRRGDKAKWFRKAYLGLKYTRTKAANIYDRLLNLKIVFDKFWTKGNEAKYCQTGRLDKSAATCPFCHNGDETQAHIIHFCLHGEMRQRRLQMWNVINSKITELKKLHPHYSKLIDELREIAQDSRYTFIWTGLWPRSLIHSLHARLERYSKTRFSVKNILNLSRIFTDEVKILFRLRAELISTKLKQDNKIAANLNTNRTSIINFFPKRNNRQKKEKKTKEKNKPKRLKRKRDQDTTPLARVTLPSTPPQLQISKWFEKKDRPPSKRTCTQKPNHDPGENLDEILKEFQQSDLKESSLLETTSVRAINPRKVGGSVKQVTRPQSRQGFVPRGTAPSTRLPPPAANQPSIRTWLSGQPQLDDPSPIPVQGIG